MWLHPQLLELAQLWCFCHLVQTLCQAAHAAQGSEDVYLSDACKHQLHAQKCSLCRPFATWAAPIGFIHIARDSATFNVETYKLKARKLRSVIKRSNSWDVTDVFCTVRRRTWSTSDAYGKIENDCGVMLIRLKRGLSWYWLQADMEVWGAHVSFGHYGMKAAGLSCKL